MQKNTRKAIKTIIILCLVIAITVIAVYIVNDSFFQKSEPLVYKTRTGECYHASDCIYLQYSAISIEKSEAIAEGLRACSRCGGTPHGYVTSNNYFASFVIVALAEFILWLCIFRFISHLKN